MSLRHAGKERRPSARATRGLPGLDWLNFFVADFQTAFGPFISVYLTNVGWTQSAIGAALSTGTIASMASQVPAGALVDARAFGERLGRNARYAAIGNAVAAGVMGACAYYLGDRAVFLFGAALAIPALAALATLREADTALLRPSRAASPPAQARRSHRSLRFLTDRRLFAFAVCAALFHLANAAMLPITAAAVTKRAGSEAGLIIAACIVGPQLITALLSPWAGWAAEAWGRRPVLLLGFGSLPIRGFLLASVADPYLIIAIQLFDGFSAAAFGVLFPLIVADATRETGHYTTCLGLVGLAIGGGATLSTTAAGLAADHIGFGGALLSLAAVGLCATVLVWALMPETRIVAERSSQ